MTPPAAPETGRKSPYRPQWWQLALGVVLLSGCCLLAAGVLARSQQRNAAGTETAIAVQPTTATTVSLTPAASAVPSATSSAAEQYLLSARRAFVAGKSDAGLVQLDQAVAVNPSDTSVLLGAGDLALEEKLAVESLRRYYVPGVKLEAAAPDAHSAGLRSHAALAFYVAAADQSASDFFDSQLSTYPDAAVSLVAQQRYQIFFAAGQGVPAALNTVAKAGAQGALASLVLGDYYLARAQLVEAGRQYTPVSDMRLANSVVPDWVIREARCDLEAIKTQRANAKVEVSCVDLSLLLTGK